MDRLLNNIEIILTRNEEDLKDSELKIYSPVNFLNKVRESESYLSLRIQKLLKIYK